MAFEPSANGLSYIHIVFRLERVNEISMSLVFRPFLSANIAYDVLYSSPSVFY